MGINRRCLDSQQFFHLIGNFIFFLSGKEDAVGAFINNRHGSIVVDRPAQMQSLFLPIFRQKPEVHIHHHTWRPVIRNQLPVDIYFSGICFRYSKDCFYNLCPSCTDKTCQSYNFSGVEIKADIPEITRSRELLNPQKFLSDFRLLLGEKVSDFMPDHVLYEHFFIAFLNIPCADIVRITKYRCSVREAENIFKTVRNQDDSNAFIAQLSCNTVQLLAFALGKSCCRFIHDQDPGFLGKSFCNFHKLLLCNRKGSDRCRSREVCTHTVQ